MDGIVLLSFEQKVLDQVFMQVDELKVGQVLKVRLPLLPCGMHVDDIRERFAD
jgi:hypothetical protein